MGRPDEDAINEVVNLCYEAEDAGMSQYPGMSYEQGVRAGVEWAVGDTEDHPLEQ